MLIIQNNITLYFDEILNDLDCQSDTRSYIIGIYYKFKNADFDLSKDSVTLLFAQGRDKQDFLTYQNLGDWLFFTSTYAPKHLQFANKDYYDTLARLSYYSCYKLINKQWKLFEQLADEYVPLSNNIKNIFIKNNII